MVQLDLVRLVVQLDLVHLTPPLNLAFQLNLEGLERLAILAVLGIQLDPLDLVNLAFQLGLVALVLHHDPLVGLALLGLQPDLVILLCVYSGVQ